MAADSDEEGNETEWRFTLEDIEQRNADAKTDEESDEEGGNVAGALSPDEEIEAGNIDLENAVFVVLGIVLAVLAVAAFANVLP